MLIHNKLFISQVGIGIMEEYKNITSYDECVNYIMNTPKFTSKNEADVTKELYLKVTEGMKCPKIIHVAGTNGKGSVSSYLNNILLQSGFKTGLFTSPHLIDIRERITINNILVSKTDFYDDFTAVMNVVDKLDFPHPTFFELLFLIAIRRFAASECDYVVLETGLGGRLDATNSVDNKVLTIITEIGLDHVEYLGDTYDKIAYEKAGILRSGVPVVYMDKRAEASKVICDRAKELNCLSIGIRNKDCKHVSTVESFTTHDLQLSFMLSIDSGRSGLILGDGTKSRIDIEDIRLNTCALYQVENASLAICAAMMLRDSAVTIKSIRAGLLKTFWPGRMEKIRDNVFLDGAHNEDGIDAMLSTVRRIKGKKILLFAVVNDKDYSSMIKQIVASKEFEQIVVTSVSGNRATDAEAIADIFINEYKASKRPVIEAIPDIVKAYEHCTKEQGTDKLIITGSLYLIGTIRGILQGSI